MGSASASHAVKDSLLLSPKTLAATMTGERLNTFLDAVTRLVGGGSSSQKKKSLEVVASMLTSTPELVPAFASSVDFAKAMESSILARGKTATAAFPIIQQLL